MASPTVLITPPRAPLEAALPVLGCVVLPMSGLGLARRSLTASALHAVVLSQPDAAQAEELRGWQQEGLLCPVFAVGTRLGAFRGWQRREAR